ncbi:hypothetical protein ABK040_002061 [Willaertia magna]
MIMDKEQIIQRRSRMTLNHLFPQPLSFNNNSQISSSNSLSNNLSSLYMNHHHVENNDSSQLLMNDTCGIVAFISRKEPAKDILMEGLTILQNRGYDSAGIATLRKDINGNQYSFHITKYASSQTTSDAFKRLRDTLHTHEEDTIGIAHTRWATHGAKTDINAHPHMDQFGRVVLIHNGVIENSSELKHELIEKHGIKFKSETDTEVIVQLIGLYLDQMLKEGSTQKDLLEQAVMKTTERLEGTWGLVIMSTVEPDRLVVARNGSPLLVGVSEGKMFVASESSAFALYTREMISLENNEIAVITADGVTLPYERKVIVEEEKVEKTPYPHPHWTIREILEQPEAISRSLNFGGRFSDDSSVKLGGLDDNKEWLTTIDHLVIAGCGTSFYAGLYGAQIFRDLKCFKTIQVIDGAELEESHFCPENSGLLVLSQSGETADVLRCIYLAEQLNIPRFSCVNKVGSTISRATKCGVYINAGRETAVASTKAFSCQVTVLALIGLWFAQNKTPKYMLQQREIIIQYLHRLPTCAGMVVNRIRNKSKEVAKHIANMKTNTLFLLGKGYGEAVAYEGSLKIKEVTYTHAEGYSSGALKHGPFALIEPGTVIFVFIFDDKYFKMNMTAATEVKSRGAYVIAVTDVPNRIPKNEVNYIIDVPSNGVFTALLANMPIQLVAYELALIRGHDPDKPRNLAKTVTVL